MKTYLKKLISILLILTSLAILFNIIKFKLFDNTIMISGDDIDLDKITIKSIEKNKVIFENNEIISKIKNQYGGDNFLVYYGDELIEQAGIEKKSWWHTHNYYFYFFALNAEIVFEFSANGFEGKTSYYKHHKIDPIINKATDFFYDLEGLTGQINIEYYDNEGKVICDEVWVNDTLVVRHHEYI